MTDKPFNPPSTGKTSCCPPDSLTTFSSTPPVSHPIKIVPAKPDASQLQQENYEAFVNGRDNMMYHRIATSRGSFNAPLSTVVHNSLPSNQRYSVPRKQINSACADVEKGTDSQSKDVYCREEGVFQIDL